MGFETYPRGLPFIQSTITNVLIVEFENGYEQRRDLWGGKTKKSFEVHFNVNTKTEAQAIESYFISKIGPATAFTFQNPVDGQTYNVRFVENSFKMERRFYGTYFAVVQLKEVFA